MTLRLEGVTVRYGGAAALIDATLELGAAEKLAVLGPSGSGKSTLLRAVAGLEPLEAGVISWAGRDLANVPPHQRGFGLMFQDYALFPNRDVRGNVCFGLEIRGDARPTTDARVAEVLELVGLSGFERRMPFELSGGEQQRVALARALAPTPRLLMLDEPLGALDRAMRAELLDELDHLFSTLGLPIIYVTHDQEEALSIGDRVCVLRAGKIEALAKPTDLWRTPPNEWVARFIGLTNVFDADLEDGVARTPWGNLGLADFMADGALRLLIRPDGLRLAPGGALQGVVESVSFRGGHTRIAVRAPGGEGEALEIQSVGSVVPEIGQQVRLEVDPAAVVRLTS